MSSVANLFIFQHINLYFWAFPTIFYHSVSAFSHWRFLGTFIHLLQLESNFAFLSVKHTFPIFQVADCTSLPLKFSCTNFDSYPPGLHLNAHVPSVFVFPSGRQKSRQFTNLLSWIWNWRALTENTMGLWYYKKSPLLGIQSLTAVRIQETLQQCIWLSSFIIVVFSQQYH